MAGDLLGRRDQMLLRMKSFKPCPGSLRLGITKITAMTWLPRLMQILRASFPELSVQFKTESSKLCKRLLDNGSVARPIAAGDLAQRIARERERWRLIVAESGIKMD